MLGVYFLKFFINWAMFFSCFILARKQQHEVIMFKNVPTHKEAVKLSQEGLP